MPGSELITGDQLEQRLGDPQLRVFDCSIILQPRPGGGYQSESGRALWLQEHVRGAGFVDLMEELSDADQRLPFMMPPQEQFVAAMSRYGVGPDNDVVLYNRGPGWWAMRLWWMLREFGFDRAAVLDGGFDKWKAERRPMSQGEDAYPPADFKAGRHRPIFVGAADVLAALEDDQTLVINALTAATHRGEGGAYARPGRIAGSVNVPAPDLFASDQTLLPPDQLEAHFAGVDALSAPTVINYCGGGISATADAFALHLLGHRRVQIYDGSLSEWARDESLPMETG